MATPTRICTNYKTLLPKDRFSKTQWKKHSDLAKCITCIANNASATTSSSSRTNPSSGSTTLSSLSSSSFPSSGMVFGANSVIASVAGSVSVMARSLFTRNGGGGGGLALAAGDGNTKSGGAGGASALLGGGSITISSSDVDISRRESICLDCSDYCGVKEMKNRQWCPAEGAGKAIGDSLVAKKIDITLSLSGKGKTTGMEELFQGLSRNRSIELLQMRVLRVHDSFEPKPDIFHSLIPFFEQNNKLGGIELYGARSWTLNSLSAVLPASCKNSRWKLININNTNAADDEAISRFFESLSNMHSLSELCLDKTSLGIRGVEGLANLLKHSATKIQSLEVCNAQQLDDERLVCLGNALAVNKTLKHLDLDMINDSISVEGWRGLAQGLRNPNSALETLKFRDDCSSGDDVLSKGVAEIVRALEGNSTLEKLDIGDDCGFIHIEDWVWELLDRVLCDRTSIASTYSSNHTLQEVIIYDYFRDFRDDFDDDAFSEVQVNVRDSLHVNENDNKSEVARQKIFERHFAGGSVENVSFARGSTDIAQVLASMPESVLVHAIEWIGRDSLGYSVMNDFVRGFPHLFDPETGPRAAAVRKRKR